MTNNFRAVTHSHIEPYGYTATKSVRTDKNSYSVVYDSMSSKSSLSFLSHIGHKIQHFSKDFRGCLVQEFIITVIVDIFLKKIYTPLLFNFRFYEVQKKRKLT